MEAAGLEFSGELAWVDTVMYWPQTHQVAPASEALNCTACHSAEGVLDFAALGFAEEEVARLSEVPSLEAPVEEPVEEPTEEPVEEPTEEPAEEAVADAPAEPEEEEQSNNTVIYIVIGVVVVLVVVVFGTRGRKKAE
jgi:hypothetical protein